MLIFAPEKASHLLFRINLTNVIMIKKLLLTIALFAGGQLSSLMAQQEIPMHIIDEHGLGNGQTYAPPRPWYITQNDYVLTLPTFDYAYTLVLLDEDGVVVYSADFSAGTTTAVLPSTLSGEFELRLVPYATTYYYRGYIELR
jgi:hypothetical protein